MNIWSIVKIVFLCLVVGLVLAALGATPATLGPWIVDRFDWVVDNIGAFFAWGGTYILLGAMVVLPVLAIKWLLSRRSKAD